MATTPAKSIHAAMTAIQSEAPQVAASSLTIDEAYGKLLAVLAGQGVLCMSLIQDHQHVTKTGERGLVSITTATVEWHFSTADGSQVVSRAVGIVAGHEPELTNPGLMLAYKQALLSAFEIVLPKPPVSTSAVSTAPVDRSAIGNKQALSDAAKALMEWREGIEKLSIEEPGDWDAHRDALKKLRGLTPADMVAEFDKLRSRAASFGVGYDESRRMFFLAEVPTMEA